MNPIYEDDETESTDIRLAKALARVDELTKLMADPLGAMAALVKLTNDFALKMQAADREVALARAERAAFVDPWKMLTEAKTMWVVTRQVKGGDVVPSLVIIGNDVSNYQAKIVLGRHAREFGREFVEFRTAKWELHPVKVSMRLASVEDLLNTARDSDDEDELNLVRDSDEDERPRKPIPKYPAKKSRPHPPVDRASAVHGPEEDEDDDED